MPEPALLPLLHPLALLHALEQLLPLLLLRMAAKSCCGLVQMWQILPSKRWCLPRA